MFPEVNNAARFSTYCTSVTTQLTENEHIHSLPHSTLEPPFKRPSRAPLSMKETESKPAHNSLDIKSPIP